MAVMDEILQAVAESPLLPVGRQGYSYFELKILLPALDKILLPFLKKYCYLSRHFWQNFLVRRSTGHSLLKLHFSSLNAFLRKKALQLSQLQGPSQ
jgi:hypothetical protein